MAVDSGHGRDLFCFISGAPPRRSSLLFCFGSATKVPPVASSIWIPSPCCDNGRLAMMRQKNMLNTEELVQRYLQVDKETTVVLHDVLTSYEQ